MATHNKVGEKGEQIAAQTLQRKGYSVLEENWRSGKNEIDIIAKIADTIVFVEVKTRSTSFFGDPSQAVSQAKQNRIIQAANDYLQQHEIENEARFDIISVIAKNDECKVEHIEDAFFPFA